MLWGALFFCVASCPVVAECSVLRTLPEPMIQTMDCFSTVANDCSDDDEEGGLGDGLGVADCAFSTGGRGWCGSLEMQEDSCDEDGEDTTAAGVPGPQCGSSSTALLTKGKGKVGSYARRRCDGSTKGIRLPWAQHVQEHLFSIDTPFAWFHREHKCAPSCPTPGRCPRRVTPEDLRLCATWSFGVDDPLMPESEAAAKRIANHSAVDRWFQLQFGLRTVNVLGQVTGISFKLVHGSGVVVCGPIMGSVYGCCDYMEGHQ